MLNSANMAQGQRLCPPTNSDVAGFDDPIVPIAIYVDGCCLGNPGPGGYCALIQAAGEARTSLVGSEPHTSSNRMALQGAIAALSEYEQRPRTELRIHSDNEYLVKNMNERIDEWKQRGWKLKSGKPPENIDLWRRLSALALRHNIEWIWVDKDDHDPLHELATQLAAEAAAAERNKKA
jgi:ribonuclease HI